MIEKKKRGRGRPKKSEQQMHDMSDVKPIDRPISEMKFNKDDVIDFASKRIKGCVEDRAEWSSKRKRYIGEFENLVRDNKSLKDGLWEGAADFHVPITQWMLKQTHSRLYQALVGDGYGFITSPGERMDRDTVERVDRLMRWAVDSYANNWRGIKLTTDDWLFDICKEGWGVLKRRWKIIEQKVVLTEEDLSLLNSSREEGEVITNMVQIIKTFDGPVVETVNHEDIFFPGEMQDPSDLDEPDFVAVLCHFTKGDIEQRVRMGLWDKDVADKIMKASTGNQGSGNSESDDVARIKAAAQGVRSRIDSYDGVEKSWPIYECCARYDVDDDGFKEDVMFWYSDEVRDIVRWTTLDRISPINLKRPLYKADFIKRPRRSYSIGLAEMLFSINREVDAMHNQRIDFGTLASIPFFFFRPASGMKREKTRIEPGMGIPLNNPNQDVSFPTFRGNTMFTRAEESQLINYGEKVASLPAITSGQSPSPAGPTMHATGFAGLLNQVGIDFEPILDRIKHTYSMFLKHLHNDLQIKMPDGYKFRLMGEDAKPILDEEGKVVEEQTDRLAIQGDFDFPITANSRTLNQDKIAQDAMVTLQTMLNPILLQSGLVTPENMYNLVKDVLKSRRIPFIDEKVTKPQDVERPLSLVNEIVVLTQGDMPRIVMNDDHETKVAGLDAYRNSQAFLKLIDDRVVPSNTQSLFEAAIKKHSMFLKSIQAQAPVNNEAGLQQSPTLGARLSGEMNQQTGTSLAQEEVDQSQTQANPFSTPIEDGG